MSAQVFRRGCLHRQSGCRPLPHQGYRPHLHRQRCHCSLRQQAYRQPWYPQGPQGPAIATRLINPADCHQSRSLWPLYFPDRAQWSLVCRWYPQPWGLQLCRTATAILRNQASCQKCCQSHQRPQRGQKLRLICCPARQQCRKTLARWLQCCWLPD